MNITDKKYSALHVLIYATFSCTCFFIAQSANAQAVIMYKTKSGAWHKSTNNLKPQKNKKSKNSLKLYKKPVVEIIKKKSKHSSALYIRNNYPGPVQVELHLENVIGASSYPRLPARFIVGPNSEIFASRIAPNNHGKNWSFKYRFRVVAGHPKAKHNDKKFYGLPFIPGEVMRVSQGFNGRDSHNKLHNRYAVDIRMPMGTPIIAARSGIVFKVIDHFTKAGKDPGDYKKANTIIIIHKDGTMAHYVHIMPNSAKVRPGDKVLRGGIVALSGNTGYSSGPHLHFAIIRNAGMRKVSVPFQFIDRMGRPYQPRVGKILSHY